MVTVDILNTWYGENAVRRFPLTGTGIDNSGRPLPDALLVGMELMVPSTMTDSTGALEVLRDYYDPFISKVIISAYEVVVTVSAGTGESGASPEEVASATVAVANIGEGATSQGFALSELTTVDVGLRGVGGRLYFGPLTGFINQPGIYEFSGPEQSAIALDCIHSYPECVRSINVDNTRITGDIVLTEGDNISLTYDNGELTIAYDPEEVTGIADRSALIAAITNRYGAPITSINSQPPDNDHNFVIGSLDNSCVVIDRADHGITISNPCATPCCDKTVLEGLMTSLQALNARYVRLHDYLSGVSANLNTLQNELSILKMSMK